MKKFFVLAAAVAFFVMHASISAMIVINGGTESMLSGSTGSVCGITSLQMGVFGGMIVGLGTAALHNRFHKIQLPQVLSFFGGSRFVPIISALVFTVVGIAMFYDTSRLPMMDYLAEPSSAEEGGRVSGRVEFPHKYKLTL